MPSGRSTDWDHSAVAPRTARIRAGGAVVAALLSIGMLARVAEGQVGHAPDRSPYRDLAYSREWTLFSGYFSARKDPVGIAPQSGRMIGGRWDWRIGGPAYLSARFAEASLDRRIIDPKQPIASRLVGTETLPLLFSDVDLGLNLTGFKTWHSLAPSLNGGFGTTWDLRGRSDVGKFKFGSPFTVNFGAALKWIVSGRWQVRADWVNYIYQIHYPQSYYIRVVGTEDPVRLPNDPTSLWRRNVAYQFGLSYLYHR